MGALAANRARDIGIREQPGGLATGSGSRDLGLVEAEFRVCASVLLTSSSMVTASVGGTPSPAQATSPSEAAKQMANLRKGWDMGDDKLRDLGGRTCQTREPPGMTMPGQTRRLPYGNRQLTGEGARGGRAARSTNRHEGGESGGKVARSEKSLAGHGADNRCRWAKKQATARNGFRSNNGFCFR